MTPDRAFLIVTPHALLWRQQRWMARPPAHRPRIARRLRPLYQPDPAAPALIRRHGPGRHRAGTAGTVPYRANQDRYAFVVPESQRRSGRGRHAAPGRVSAMTGALARCAYGLLVVSALGISGWFAAPGASVLAVVVGAVTA